MDAEQNQDANNYGLNYAYADLSEAYQSLGVDILSIEIGYGLLKLADPDQGGDLVFRVAGLRSRLTEELGYILPTVSIRDHLALSANEYVIKLRGVEIARGTLSTERVLVAAHLFATFALPEPADAVTDRDPVNGAASYWINPAEVPKALQEEHLQHPNSVLINHLNKIALQYVDEIVSRKHILQAMEWVRRQDQGLVDSLTGYGLDVGDLRTIFVQLIREQVSIKDMMFVFERLNDYARFNRQPDILAERLRSAMGRRICHRYATPERDLIAVTIGNDWEALLDENCQQTELGMMFLLNPIQVQELLNQTVQAFEKSRAQYGKAPVILCSPRIRAPLFQLLDRHIADVAVLSYSELTMDYAVRTVGSIGTHYANPAAPSDEHQVEIYEE